MIAIVAVAGGTCSGKSTLASALFRLFPDDLTVLEEDCFYPDRSALSEDELSAVNWDSIDSIDAVGILDVIEQLASVGCAHVPVYDRSTHKRYHDEAIVVSSSVVALEGLHAITLLDRWRTAVKRVAELPVLRIFIDCPEAIRYDRRRTRERAKATVPGNFDLYWTLSCEPIFRQEVLLQLDKADLVIRCPVEDDSLKMMSDWISIAIRSL
jgi:uridine kinase